MGLKPCIKGINTKKLLLFFSFLLDYARQSFIALCKLGRIKNLHAKSLAQISQRTQELAFSRAKFRFALCNLRKQIFFFEAFTNKFTKKFALCSVLALF